MLSKLLRYRALTLISIIVIAPVLSPDGTQFAMIRNEQIVLMPSGAREEMR